MDQSDDDKLIKGTNSESEEENKTIWHWLTHWTWKKTLWWVLILISIRLIMSLIQHSTGG